MPRTVLVTVGSTLFQDLTNAVLERETLDILSDLGFTLVMVQYGSAVMPRTIQAPHGMTVKTEAYIKDLEALFATVDLIISHAGSGSILSGLRAGKKMVVVPNTSLMDNHQEELANVLHRENYLLVATPDNLSKVLADDLEHTRFEAFPDFQPQRFNRLVEELFD